MIDQQPCCYQHWQLGLRWLHVSESRQKLMMEQASRVAQTVGKSGQPARNWWLQHHEVLAHYKLPEPLIDQESHAAQ